MKVIYGLVFLFAIYFAEAKSFGAPVVVAKRDVLAQADLLAKLAGLLGKSGGIIAELEKQGKPLLAAGIKKVEEILISLEEKVKNANPHTEIGKLALKGLDELILLAEHKLEDEIKKLTTTFSTGAGQVELMEKLAALLGKSGGIIAELEKEGKPLLAAGIKKVEELLISLEQKVKNANPHNIIGKLALEGLDELIILAEHKLEDEIKKLTTTYSTGAGQVELLEKLAALLGKSNGVIAELEKNGKPLLAAGIQKVEDLLKSLEEKVKNANPHTEVGKLVLKGLDELIILAEHKLEDEIKKLTTTFSIFKVAKREVIAQAEMLMKLLELLNKSKLAQELLEKEGKPLLAAGLKKIDDVLHDLDTKVRNADPKTEIGKLALKGLDELIVLAEHKLEDEIKKLTGTFSTGAGQVELLEKLALLLGKSGGLIAQLEKEGKPLLAAGIQKVEDLLKSLEEKVKNANPHTEIGKLALKGLDELIILAEHKLEDEIKKLTTTFSAVKVVKRELVLQAEMLLKLAEMLSKSKLAQELLEKEGKPLLALGLKKVDELLHSLDTKVRNANPSSEIGKLILKGLDWLIVAAEHKLEEELTKIEGSKPSGSFYDVDMKDGLLKMAQSLRETAMKAIDFLKAQGKSFEAAELELLETVVGDIEQRLETLHPTTEIGKLLLTSLEGLLKNAETKLNEVLNKLNAHP